MNLPTSASHRKLLFAPDCWDTPDFFQLPLDGDQAWAQWILHEGGRQYQIGEFNGRAFIPTTKRQTTFIAGSYLASYTFDNAPDGRRIQVGATSGLDMSYAVGGQKRKVEPVNSRIKVRLICDRSLVSFYINDGYEAGNCYLAGFRPECQQALSLQGAADQVFETFTVRTLRPTRPATATEPQ